MTVFFAFLLTVSGVATAAWLVATRRKIAAAFGDGRTALALVGFVVLANAAPALAGEHSSALIGLLVLGLLAWVVGTGGRDVRGPSDGWLRLAWWTVAVLLLWCLAVDAIVGAGLYGSRLVSYAAAGLFLLAGLLVAARTAVTTRALAYTGLAVLALLTIPTVFSGTSAWRTCTGGQLEKCSLAGALFKSFFESENYVAMVATFTLVAALCAMRRRELLVTATLCLLVIVATGSRTSYLALAAGAAWLAGSYLLERWRRFERIPLVLSAGLVVVFGAAATYLMWSADRSTLSNRGNIWVHARDYIAERKVTGVGVSKWYYLRDVGEAPTHFFHSGYVLAIFAGGFIALVIWGIWASALLHGRVRDGRAFTAKAPVVLFLVYSVTEVVWNPLSVDGLSWIFLLLMLIRAAGSPRDALAAPGPVDAVDRPGGLAGLRALATRHHLRRTRVGSAG
ncbi:O-antigen ligase family protein [Micromonospora chersina]|uniref:O-antigen ligase family protein n=1 Tax=Micromonospora chersina TaxID=47854 RepID=UPI00371AA522